ncbi:Kynurenine formamidase protein [Rutstroemia sp. NJR-2017a BVV2]|nr:Kynurenine formamidase protein [Rutstroemia sp. NJR-2017a BVV2]
MASYENKDPIDLAKQAEVDLNSHALKHGVHNTSDSGESGVNQGVESKFPGASVTYGSAASGAGDNREIPVQDGGDIGANGQPTKAKHFEGPGGPEDKARIVADQKGGDDGVPVNTK